MSKTDIFVLSCRLKDARKDFGITQDQLSMLTGISQNTISSLEKGLCNPSVKHALLICDVLNCKIEDIWTLQ